MKGKDWFIVGARLIGLGLLYWGFHQAMTFMTRGMLFANLDIPAFFDPIPPWLHLVNGGLTGGFALVLLAKAEALADWCYGKAPVLDPNDYDDDDRFSPIDEPR